MSRQKLKTAIATEHTPAGGFLGCGFVGSRCQRGCSFLRRAMKSKSKYGNKKVVIDGIKFDSKREAQRYGALQLMLKAGLISNLRMQVPYQIVINGKKCFKYLADFVYDDGGKEIIEDVKGFRTPLYRLKKKIVEAWFGVVIVEVK